MGIVTLVMNGDEACDLPYSSPYEAFNLPYATQYRVTGGLVQRLTHSGGVGVGFGHWCTSIVCPPIFALKSLR